MGALNDLARALYDYGTARRRANIRVDDIMPAYIVVTPEYWRAVVTDPPVHIMERFYVRVGAPEQRPGELFAATYRFCAVPVMIDPRAPVPYRFFARDEPFTRTPAG